MFIIQTVSSNESSAIMLCNMRVNMVQRYPVLNSQTFISINLTKTTGINFEEVIHDIEVLGYSIHVPKTSICSVSAGGDE